MSCEVIVEVGNSHEGSLGIALSFIDMAVDLGVNAIKFQMHMAEMESSSHEPFRLTMSGQDRTRSDYWKRTGFNEENWLRLASYCDEKNIEFLCTPFSIQAAEFLYKNGLVRRWKVGSGDATNIPFLTYLGSTQMDIILSTGLLTTHELSLVKAHLENIGAWERTTLLYCVSKYPAALEDFSLAALENLKVLQRPVGFSDHSGNPTVSKFMIAQGASIVEIHMTPHPSFYGPDTTSSLVPDQIREIVKFAKEVQTLRIGSKSHDDVFQECLSNAKLFRKGLYWKESIKKGTQVLPSHLNQLKPVIGVDSLNYALVLKSKVSKDVFAGDPVHLTELNASDA